MRYSLSSFSIASARYVEVDRAVAELRQGRPVLVEEGLELNMLYAAETLLPSEWQALQDAVGAGLCLVISANRARALGMQGAADPSSMAAIPLAGLPYSQLEQLIGAAGGEALEASLLQHAQATMRWVGHQATILSLLTVAELLPAAILVPVALEGAAVFCPHITAVEIAAYVDATQEALIEVTRAPLHLKVAQEATMIAFRFPQAAKEHYAIWVKPKAAEGRSLHDVASLPLARVHSSCFTGDLMGSITCDCGEQLQSALLQMAEDPAGGILLYLQQEGRGIGLINKLRCYREQARGLDTVEANEILGFEDDARAFSPAARMLKYLGISAVRLLSNNPYKAEALEQQGIHVAARVQHVVTMHPLADAYLSVKKQRLGHVFEESARLTQKK